MQQISESCVKICVELIGNHTCLGQHTYIWLLWISYQLCRQNSHSGDPHNRIIWHISHTSSWGWWWLLEGLLETVNARDLRPCLCHCLAKDLSGGWPALATTPFDKASLNRWLHVIRIILNERVYCLWIKLQPFKKYLPLSCSFSAHMLSKQHEIAKTFCIGRTFTFLTSIGAHVT